MQGNTGSIKPSPLNILEREGGILHEKRSIILMYPKRFLTIIVDQKKTDIPILYTKARNSKEISNLQQVRTHLLGVLVHRDSETSVMKKVGFGHFDLMQYPHDANLNLTVLLETLCEFKDALETELHLQTDGASDNKNKVLGFLGLLVRYGIFEECYLHMLPVGHTHEDIYSVFKLFKLFKRHASSFSKAIIC